MDVDFALGIPVFHRRPRIAVWLHPGPSQLLEFINGAFDLLVGWLVLHGPGNHSRRVRVFELECVGNIGDLAGIPAQNLDVLPLLAFPVKFLQEVVGSPHCRARAVLVESNQHPCCS